MRASMIRVSIISSQWLLDGDISRLLRCVLLDRLLGFPVLDGCFERDVDLGLDIPGPLANRAAREFAVIQSLRGHADHMSEQSRVA